MGPEPAITNRTFGSARRMWGITAIRRSVPLL